MKIAVCISGQPRSWQKGYMYLKKNLLVPYDGHVDVFYHAWIKHWDGTPYDLSFNREVLEMQNIIKAKRCDFNWGLEESGVFEKYNKKYTNTPDPVRFPPANVMSAYKSMLRASKLLSAEEKLHGPYDWVVRTRFDYALNGVLPFKDMDPTKLYIPHCRMVPERDFGNDQFAVGGSEVMHQYMSTAQWIKEFYAAGVPMNGELMMQATIRKFGLVGDRLVYMDMRNQFPPGKYNGSWHNLLRDDREQW